MAPFLMSVFFLFYSYVLPFQASAALPNNNNKYQCSPFSCGRLGDLINFPFINNPNNSHCGSLVLNCSDDSNPKLHFPNQRKWYSVDRMSPIERRINIRDPQLQSDLEQNRCHSLSNFTLPTSPFFNFYHQEQAVPHPFFKCKQQQQRHDKLINTSDQGFFFRSLHNYSGCVDGYVLYFTGDLKESLPALPESFINNCSIVELPIFGWRWGDPSKTQPIENLSSLWAADYSLGWEVDSFCFDCYFQRGGFCQQSGTGNPKYNYCGGFNNRSSGYATRKLIIGMSVSLSAFVLLLLCCYSRKKCLATKLVLLGERSKNGGPTIDNFLQNYDSLAPKRYSYTDIKQMTKSFKSKLGQGGYGGVFKGKLRDGRLVAVKLLKEAKGNNGEEFINEVASISRTSHVNIVSLLGFCCERSKRALVYEFMPNGSLDKFIYLNSPNSCSSLSLDTLYDIAVGIARGLAYLHRGCSTRIVHFDIKPHNILLDHNFCPKISDFGLAKLCTRKDSIISMLGVRGTIGYIAPELVCVNYGGVSHKSDVYSYGMMVLEMVGARHNTDVGADHTSEMYFPYWIYEHLVEEEALRLHGEVSADQKEIAKKMILVSLWCIQTKPSDRPSINLVLEMLEGRLESIETPPKPFLYTPERSADDSSAL